MAKITRYQGDLEAFGSNAVGQERVIFGDTDAAQSDDLTDNINADLLRGWGALPLGNKPPREWFTSVHWVSTQLSAYLHQIGIAEWHIDQEYHTGSTANISGFLFESLSDSNVGNDPQSDAVNWKLIAYPPMTTLQLINLDFSLPQGTVISTSGYNSSGDEGAASWFATGVTGEAPSESPATRGTGELTDATGRAWRLVANGLVTIDSVGDKAAANTYAKAVKFSKQQITQTTVDDFSVTAQGFTHKYVGRQSEGAGSPLVSVVRNDSPDGTVAFPSAMIAYGRNDSEKSQVFGFFGRVDQHADSGVVTHELNTFNESGIEPPLTLTPNRSFTTTQNIPCGLTVAAGGDSPSAANSHTGIHISNEGGSTTSFRIGCIIDDGGFLNWGYCTHSEVLDKRHVYNVLKDDSQAFGPDRVLERNSASPAANDLLGRDIYAGRNDAAERIEYAYTNAKIEDATDGNESGLFEIRVRTDGVGPIISATVGRGVFLPGVADAGASTFNCSNGYFVADKQVLSTRRPAIPDSVGGDEQAKINAILTALRDHGLIEP